MENILPMRLFQLREAAGESQDQVADAVEISRVAYTRYENGTREPKVTIALKIARHFGVTVEQLLNEEKVPRESRESIDIQPHISKVEHNMIIAYRSSSRDTQKAVCNVLGIESENIAKAN